MKIQIKVKYSSIKSLNFLFQIVRSIDLKKKKDIYNVLNRDYNKVFCIGFGKTGTTSLEKALVDFGFVMGNQAVGEILSEDWATKRVDRIIDFCYTADAFQDMPFGLPGLYKELDKAFPKSRFILTIRNDEEQWYNSLIRFHAKLFSEDKTKLPTDAELRNTTYRYRGWELDMKKLFFDYPRISLYDKEFYQKKYLFHIDAVKEYFIKRKDDLLVLNVAQNGSYQKLADFLDIEVEKDATFPWLNKT